MARIEKIAYYLPEKIETNEMLEKENPDWDLSKVEKRIGIKQRHIANSDETALDLAVKASEKVLSNYDRERIDFVILCTQSPDYFLPTSACILQDRLRLRENIGAYDFNLGCSGYIYGLAMAKGLIDGNLAETVLLVTAETYSKFIHPKDRSNRSIFGDGAAATIIEKHPGEMIYAFEFGTRGSGYDKLIVKNGGLRNRIQSDVKEWEYGSGNITSNSHLYMDGPEIYSFSQDIVPNLVEKILDKSGTPKDVVDYYIYHQANKFMVEQIRKKQGIDKDKFHFNIERTGNTVSSTIPIALKDALISGKVSSGSKILLAGFGVGLSWAGCLVEL